MNSKKKKANQMFSITDKRTFYEKFYLNKNVQVKKIKFNSVEKFEINFFLTACIKKKKN